MILNKNYFFFLFSFVFYAILFLHVICLCIPSVVLFTCTSSIMHFGESMTLLSLYYMYMCVFCCCCYWWFSKNLSIHWICLNPKHRECWHEISFFFSLLNTFLFLLNMCVCVYWRNDEMEFGILEKQKHKRQTNWLINSEKGKMWFQTHF